jgi:hypothetical protein
MIKLEELTNPQSCMSRAGDHEMTFVLLARDAAAPETIRFWVQERIRLGKNDAQDDQILEALHCAKFMEQQQRDKIGLTSGQAASPAVPPKRMMVNKDGDLHEECRDCRGECSPAVPQPSAQPGQTINPSTVSTTVDIERDTSLDGYDIDFGIGR